MIALYIIGGILLFLLIVLLIPVSADMSYKDKLFVAVKYGGIKVFDSRKPEKEKPENKQAPKTPQKPPEEKPKKENFFTKTFNEKGKIEGIRFFAQLIKAGISRIIWVIRKIKFRRFFLDISIASDDAANTAIAYGAVCAAVYPTVNFIDQNTDLSVKKVNIYTDFDKLSPEIEAAVSVKTRFIYAVIAAISFFFAYLRIKKESDNNERKQPQ